MNDHTVNVNNLVIVAAMVCVSAMDFLTHQNRQPATRGLLVCEEEGPCQGTLPRTFCRQSDCLVP